MADGDEEPRLRVELASRVFDSGAEPNPMNNATEETAGVFPSAARPSQAAPVAVRFLSVVFVVAACAASAFAQTVSVTSAWQAQYQGTTRTIAVGSSYGIGQTVSRTASGQGGAITNELTVALDRVTVSVDGSATLLPPVPIAASSSGELRVVFPPTEGHLEVTGAMLAVSASSTVDVDIDADGTIEATLAVGSPANVTIPVDSDEPIQVAITVSANMSTSTIALLDADLTVRAVPFHRAILSTASIEESGANHVVFPVGRTQILIPASDFLDLGVEGPITISRLWLPGRDGHLDSDVRSTGGAQVMLYATFQSLGQLSSNFAANVGSAIPLGFPSSFGNTEPLTGATPNSPRTTALVAATFDPTGSQPNLLIDITANFNTLVGELKRGGIGLRAASASASNGNFVGVPAVGIRYYGSGARRVPPVARTESYGAACGGQPASFYQQFSVGQRFDLSGLTLTPDTYPNPSVYTVTASAPAYDATKIHPLPNTTADDATISVPLGFSFDVPGGSFDFANACTNGFLHLGAPQAYASPALVDVSELLSSAPLSAGMLAPFWYDFHCGRNDPPSGLHVRTVGTAPDRECYVSWHDVGVHHSRVAIDQANYRMQCVLHEATGVIEFRYGNMPEFCGTQRASAVAGLVGFSPGNVSGVAAVDPRTRDLSHEVPFTTSVEGARANMGLWPIASPVSSPTYGGRLFGGQSVTWEVADIPTGSPIGVLIVDFAASQPGLSIPGIHAPGCVESTTIAPVILDWHVSPPSSLTTTAILAPQGYQQNLLQFTLYAQYAVLDLSGNGPIVTVTSNAVKHTLGRR